MFINNIVSVYINAGQIVGYSALAVAGGVACFAAWNLKDVPNPRCPRCGAAVWRFARTCPCCRREITAHPARPQPGAKSNQKLAGLLVALTLLIVGGLAVVFASRPTAQSGQLATLERPAALVAPPPLGARALRPSPADDPWPSTGEVIPPDANPEFASRVEASKARARLAHPALAVPSSAFQTALIARGRELADEHSPRLKDPGWPEDLADEVALRIKSHSP